MTEPTIAQWLLARIAEDEADAREHQSSQEWVQEAAGWWDCDRVLAECEAKRKIVEFCAKDEDSGFESIEAGVYARTVMGLLALPYADRPGFREEWTA